MTHMYTSSCPPASEEDCSFHLPYSAAHVATDQQPQIQEVKGCGLGCDTLLLPGLHLHPFKDPLNPSSEHLPTGYLHHFWALSPIFSSYFPPDFSWIYSHILE